MKILGISEPDSDAGAALIQDGEILYAANEERFSRKKLHQGFPYKTIEWLLAESGWSLDSIDVIAIANPPFWEDRHEYYKNLKGAEDNPHYYGILEEYKKLPGCDSCVLTRSA